MRLYLMNFKLLLISIFFLFPLVVKSQVTSFNSEPAIFITEFEKFIAASGDEEIKKELKIFITGWNTGKFSPVQRESIIKISNNMVGQKLAVIPYFSFFMRSMSSFVKNNLPAKNLDQWQNITSSLLNKNKTAYLNFLELSCNLFSNGILYQTNTLKWKASNLNFDLEQKNNRISIVFKSLDLNLIGSNDSIFIKNTSGIYYTDLNEWEGKKGTISFDRVVKTDKVFVEINQYKLNLKTTQIDIDTVKLVRAKYFATPILGVFKDKLNLSSDSSSLIKGGYPKFQSFQNSLEIKGIVGENATFVGGYAINGKEVLTKNTSNSPTIIHIYFEGKKKITVTSKEFKITDGAARSSNASFILYTDSGNITHPGLSVNFQFSNDQFTAIRNDIGLQRRPFADDFHKIDIFVDEVSWKIKTPFVDFDNINNDQAALFASKDFFKDALFLRVKGALDHNPVEALTAFHSNVLKRKTTSFHLNEYSQFIKSKPEYLRATFIDLHDLGYVIFNPETDSVNINLKSFAAVQSHNKVRDYDVIRLSSTVAKRKNAILNLRNNNLDIEGVQKFYFSDSQSVMATPTEQQVTIRKNRELRFGGLVAAGRFDFFGKEFKFNYDLFNMDYTRIDSMRMYFPSEDGKGDVAIKSVLRNIYGTLLIDKPNNKSGLKNYPEYPIFRSSKGSEILYDKPNIHAGAYKSDNFKFLVDPFEIDSLDNFTLSGLQFDGTFLSADIFPEFRHKASIQKDYSLGFVKKTPPGGLAMYKGKGLGEMTMELSEQGFYGTNGTITYESSETKFEKLLLLPDKTVGTASSYHITQNAKYPQVNAISPTVEWSPYDNNFAIKQGTSPIKVFKMEYDFYGTLNHKPSKLQANGELRWDLARLNSAEIDLTPNKAGTKKGSLQIYTKDTTKIAFETRNINGNFDFDSRLGKFGTNEKNAETLFPFNTFATNLNDFDWNMDKKIITAKLGPAMAGAIPMFISTNPLQDSLKFEGKRGIYDLNNYTLTVEEIPFIDIADSRLFLVDGRAKIKENGDIENFVNAKLIANRTDKFHNMYNINMKVYGRLKVRGSGNYIYTTKAKLKQEFKLDSIIVADKAFVHGIGKINGGQNFTLDTKIGYKGFAKVKSNDVNLEFIGYVKPLHTFTNIIPSDWIMFNGVIDPNKVIIDINNPRDSLKKPKFVGLFIANDSSHVYPLFLSWKRRYSDPDVSNDSGIFYFDNSKNSFFAGNKDKLLNGALKGNFMQLNETDHSIHAEGLLDFGLESEIIKFKSAGTADLKAGDSSFNFDMAMMLDFPLPKEYNERLKQLLLGEGAGTINPNNEFFINAIGEMVSDTKNADKIIENIKKKGIIDGKDEAKYKFIFNNADFRWDPKLRGMYYSGDVDLLNFDGTAINKTVRIDMLFEHKRSGENIYLYIDYGNGEYFYVNLLKNFAYIASSDAKLKEIFSNTYLKLNVENYSLRPATERNVARFRSKLGAE